MQETKICGTFYVPFPRFMCEYNLCDNLNIWHCIFVDQAEFSSIPLCTSTIICIRTSWNIMRQIFSLKSWHIAEKNKIKIVAVARGVHSFASRYTDFQ